MDIESWARAGEARAVTDADHALEPLISAARACVLEHLQSRDGLNAAALLGRAIASSGGSPGFVATELDVLASETDPEELAAMRAALLEGYCQALDERSTAERDGAWEPPGCVVVVGEGVVAIAAGHPSDAADTLGAWADRVASWALRAKAKRAILSGRKPARDALRDALSLVGIEALDAQDSARARPRL